MSDFKIIDNTQEQECYRCLGTGHPISPGAKRKDTIKKICKACKGTGKWLEEHFFLITEVDGQKIAFDIDNIGK